MARYLSPEWIAELDRVATAATSESGSEQSGARLAEELAGVTLVVEQRVAGAPSGDVVYAVRIEHGRVRVEPGPAADADLVLLADYPTARSLARGELNAQEAFAAGRLKLRGRLDLLVAHARALAALTTGLDALRATTEFD